MKIMNNNVKALKKYYANATKEEVIEDMFRDACHLQTKIDDLEEEIKELELHVGLRQKRNLISKFDKEYDLEDKKKNPNRTYACIMPDAEEVYKRYYDYKERNSKAIEILKLCNSKCAKETIEILKGE